MTTLNVNNSYIIEVSEDITYNFQAASVADMSLSKSNYTSTFQIPRTTGNVQRFNGLGLVVDASPVPYAVNNTSVSDNYNPIYSGSLVILKTNEYYYESTVISGTRDIFALMGDLILGDIPVIRNLLPAKTPDSVADLCDYWAGSNVAFIPGNYGGISHVLKSTALRINVDCLAVSYRVNFLWNAIFNYIGVPNILENFNTSDINDKFLTFPYPPYPEVVSSGSIGFKGYIPSYINSISAGLPNAWKSWTSLTLVDFTVSGFTIICQTPGTYIIDIPSFIAEEGFSNNVAPFDVVLLKDGVEIARFRSQRQGTSNPDESIYKGIHSFNSGSQLTIDLQRIDGRISNGLMFIDRTEFNISRTLFTDESKKKILNVKLKDFVKEFMYRFSLMGFYDNNFIRFIKVGDIINSEPIDWTDKFIKRTSEVYDIGYSQNNWLRHKYVNEDVDYYDRNVQSNNMNLPLDNTIVTSSFFASSFNYTPYSLGGTFGTNNTIQSQLFNTYTADDKGKVKTETRNFWINGVRTYVNSIYFGSQTMSDEDSAFELDILAPAYLDGFNQNNEWTDLTSFLIDTRVKTIELKLSSTDISSLNLRRVYFFQQEAGFFMLTKLQFKKGEKAIGEFVRILR